MLLLRILSLVLLLALLGCAADSPFTGTWKLSPAKSRLLPGDTTVSDIYRTVADETKIKVNERVTDDKGVHNSTIEAKFDGKDYPVQGDPMSDSVSYQRLDPRRIRVTTKKAGLITAKASAAVSGDGKVIVVNFTVFSEEGSQSGMAVYEKQPD